MIQTRPSTQGKRAFLSINPKGIGSCRYFAIILLTLSIISMGIFPGAAAAGASGDSKTVLSPSFNQESSSATNFTVMAKGMDTLFATNLPRNTPVEKDSTGAIKLMAAPAGSDTNPETSHPMYAPIDEDSTDAMNHMVTPAGADTPFDAGYPMYAPVEEDTIELMNLTAIAAAENETYAYNLVDKGIDCYNSGNTACAFESFEAAHNILPNDANILYVQAQAFSLQKRYDEALVKIEAGIALDPEVAELWYQKGVILNNMGKYFESGSSFDRAAELEPGYEFPVTDRFPFNVIIKNCTLLLYAIGFCALGCIFYSKEIRK